MPRVGAYIVSELPEGLIAVRCARCGKFGQYRRKTLLARIDSDTPLPHVLVRLANCSRFGNFSDNCGAVYSQLLGVLRP